MKKLVKYSVIVGGALLLLVIVGLIAAPYLLNLDALREWGERQASSRLGREVTIEEVRFSWLGPKVSLTGFSIAEAEDFGTGPFARFDSFDLKVRPWDLLRLRLAVEHVILSAPKIRLVRNSDGRFNFDDILERFNAPAQTASAPLAAMAPGDPVKAPPVDLLVQEIRVEDGTFLLQDATIPRLSKGITFESASLTLTDLSFDRPMTIAASLGLNQPGEDVRFEGEVGPLGKVILPGKIPFDLSLSLEPFELARIPGILGPLPMGVSGVLSAAERVHGTLETGILFEGKSSLRGLNVKAADGKQQVSGFDGAAAMGGRLDVNARDLFLETFRLEAYQAVFEVAGSVRRLGRAPAVSLDVSSNAIPLSGWDKVLPQLGPMVKLDGDLTFKGKVRGTVRKDLTADLSLASKKFEIDRGPALLERSSSEAAAPPGGEPLKPIKAPPITVTGTVTVQEGRFEKIPFTDLKASLSQKGTRFSLDDMTLHAFSGVLEGMAWADLGALPLEYGSRVALKDIEVNDALGSVAGLKGILYGKVSMDLSLSGKGTEFEDLKKYLTGKGSFRGADGRLTSVNLGSGGAKAASLLGVGEEGKETRFQELAGSFAIEDGKVKLGDLKIAAGQWAMAALGDIGLDKTLAMLSKMTLSKEATAGIPEKTRQLFPKTADGRVQVPLKIGGTVTSPSISLDSSAMNQAAKEEIKKKVEEKTDTLKEQLQKDVGEKLKKLF